MLQFRAFEAMVRKRAFFAAATLCIAMTVFAVFPRPAYGASDVECTTDATAEDIAAAPAAGTLRQRLCIEEMSPEAASRYACARIRTLSLIQRSPT